MLIKVKRLLLGGMIATGLAVATAVVPVTAAEAVPVAGSVMTQDSGLYETSKSRFVVDDKARVVRARTTVTIRNDMASSGGRYYYYFAYKIPVPSGVTRVRAKSNGASLPVKIERTGDASVRVASASFSDLYYGHSRTITWTYTMKGGAFRSKDPVRVGPGYAAFPVALDGDPGAVSVDVVVPREMRFAASSEAFKEQTPKGKDTTVTWSASTGPHETGIWSGVSARDPDKTDERKIKVGGTALTLQAFPGDKAWLDFVEKQVKKGLPRLEKVMGLEWPGGLDTIREDVSSEVIGYAWFDSTKHEIVLGEKLDQELLFHEMSHAWLNGDRFVGRWLIEGLADTVAHRTALAVGGKGNPHPTPDRHGKDAFPLSRWETDTRPGADDEYGYDAAYATVNGMVKGLDDKQFARVVSAADKQVSAYEKPGSSAGYANTDWRRFLDLVEAQTGTDAPEAPLKKWVLTSDDRGLLKERAKARASYRATDEANGTWAVPAGLRTQMANWQFPSDSDGHTPWLPETDTKAVAVQRAAARYGLAASPAIRREYENFAFDQPIDELNRHLTKAASTTTLVGRMSRSVKQTHNPLSWLGRGVLGVSGSASDARHRLDTGHLAAAEKAAHRARSLAPWAPWTAIVLLLLVAGAVWGGVVHGRRLWPRARAWWRMRQARKAALDDRSVVSYAEQLTQRATERDSDR